MTVDLKKEDLAEIIHNIYLLTEIKMVFFDADFKLIVSEPECDTDFCSVLRKNKEFKKRCDECTKAACIHAKDTNVLNVYRCHAGLIEAVIPIFIDDIFIGYIMLGQVIDNELKLSDKKKIIDYASKYTKNTEKLFDKLVTKDMRHIQAAVQIMESCVYYILAKNLIKINHGQVADQLREYIKKNLTASLTVEELCNKFFLSRNMIYKIFRKNFNITVSKYIKTIRISKAKELISGGMSITEAAVESGFKDYNYFTKVFKKETGTSPLLYKKSLYK